jgi:hypothetical protein
MRMGTLSNRLSKIQIISQELSPRGYNIRMVERTNLLSALLSADWSRFFSAVQRLRRQSAAEDFSRVSRRVKVVRCVRVIGKKTYGDPE